MNWYLAKMVFRVFCGNANHPPQFDEQLRVIHAEDEFHAFHKARLLGEGDYLADEADVTVNVKWKFIDVTELHPLMHFIDGAAIYSVIKEETDADLYIRNTRIAATQLLQQSMHQFTT